MKRLLIAVAGLAFATLAVEPAHAQPIPPPGLQRVAHDSSLTGSGTTAAPIGVRTAVGGGVQGGGVVPVGLVTTCSDGQVLQWVAATPAWTCTTPSAGGSTAVFADSPLAGSGSSGSHLTWTPTLGNLQGTGSAGNALRTNLTVTTCATGARVSGIAADGTGTCTATVVSMAATASGGLACSTASGAAQCGLITSCGSNQVLAFVASVWTCATPAAGTVTSIATTAPITGGTITGTGTIGLSLTTTSCSAGQAETATAANGTSTCSAVVGSVANGTGISTSTSLGVATINVNLTTTTCTAGQAVTAIAAAGTGTCTTLISGTSGTIPLFATANTLGNSSLTDDGTTFKVNSTALTVTEATGATVVGNRLSGGERILSGGAATFLQGGGGVGGLDFLSNTNAAATGHINDVGFSFSTTQFRNLEIDDGKGAIVATFTGSTKDLTLAATETVTGLATLTGGFSAGANSTTNGNALTVGILLVGGHISFDTGAAPTVSSCGASPSIATGSTDVGGIITLGAATTTLCTYTFATTWSTRAPFCTCSNAGSTSTEALVSCTASTTVLTINATSASSAGVFAYHCQGST